MKLLLLFFILISISYANILQETIDKASPGSILKLSSGVYPGQIVIDKPLTIIGKSHDVVIEGGGTGRVITINSSGVVLKNLTVTNSGGRMENLDSAIKMDKVSDCEISNCKILNSLYGIDMVMVQNSIIQNNYITSKKNDIELRGDALKIWYSNGNIIRNNRIDASRDITLTYSNNNIIEGNTITNNRFGLHIGLSRKNRITDNIFKYNSVAIIVMGVMDTNVTKNQIKSSKGAAGIGIVIKGSSNFHLEGNTISYNAQGIYIDSKNTEEGMQRYIKNNEISYNKEAMHFHAIIKNNTIRDNKIFGNIDDVVRDSRANVTIANDIGHNYWDRYAGFDKNGDNIGDTPHRVYQYADQLWEYNNKVKFFYASPVMSLMNFLASLAPFIDPVLLLEDKTPIVNIED
ncbi:nitrous oxide reductase family maturation protein NosD [Sulfurimonas sp. HSL-1716]|uniref:nitrous oxide reductase family maturation protein NosD n=1 Tax=Hydrocurvibacter sulfurireducens TaxID=3131937 RepID=UPI0031F9A682